MYFIDVSPNLSLMKLKEWRKKKKLSQEALAKALEDYVAKKYPELPPRPLKQRTLAAWELGTLPRKFWINTVKEYTKGQVGAADFAATEDAACGA